jgi:FkbM family methyltransferase
MLKKFLYILPSKFSDYIFFSYQKLLFKYQSYYFCQNDLDLKIMKYIKKRNGVYLEIGAFDGLIGSVSLRFENMLNWSGILIEPLKSRYEKLKQFRGDKNICVHSACTESDKNKTIELNNLGRMSFLNNKKKLQLNKKKHSKEANRLLLGNKKVELIPNNTLTNILLKYRFKNIDLAIIDVEGSELLLLKGLKLKEINIKFVCIETNNIKETSKVLKKNNYSFLEKLSSNDYLFKKR